MMSDDVSHIFAQKLLSAIAAPACIIYPDRRWTVNRALLSLLGYTSLAKTAGLDDVFSSDDLAILEHLLTDNRSGEYHFPVRRQFQLMPITLEPILVLLNIDRIEDDACCLVITLLEVEHQIDRRGGRLFNNEDVVFIEWHRGDYNLIGQVSDNIRQFGYTPDEFLSRKRSYNTIIHPSDLDWVRRNIDLNVENKVPYSYWEYRIICQNGEVRWVADFTIMDFEHPTISATSYLLDVTPFRKVNDALTSSRRMYRQLAQHLPDMNVILYNSELRFIIIEGQLSFIPKSAENKTLREVLSPERVELLLPHFRAALTGQQSDLKYAYDDHHYMLDFLPVLGEESGIYHGMLVIEDVTREYQIQAELRESRERLDRVVDSIDDVIWSIQASPFKVLYISNSTEALYGYTEDEFINSVELWFNIIHPDDRSIVYGEAHNLSAHGSSDLEFRIVRKDETIRWVRSRSKAIRDADHRIVRIDGITSDITSRIEAEKALRESEELYRLIANDVSDMIARNDIETRFTYVSPSSVRVMGYTPEELLGTKAEDYVHPDDRTIVPSVRTLPHKNKPQDVSSQFRVRHKDGHWIWVESSGRTIVDETGRIVGSQFVTRDITHRKVAEDALRESEERFRQIAENIHELFYIYKKDHFTYVSPAFETLWGRSLDQIYKDASAYIDWIHPDDRERIVQALQRERRENIRFNEEYRIVHTDGTIHWLWARNFMVRNDKNEYHVVGIAEDITPQKLALEALLQSEDRFHQLTENINEVFYIFHKDHFVYISPAYENIWQRSIKEFYDIKYHLNTIIESDRERVKQVIKDHMHTSKTYEVEYRIARPDGEIRWIWARNFPVGSQEEEVYLVGVAEDITERKNASLALLESESRFQQIANTVSEVFYIRNLVDNRFEYVSPAYEKIWKRPVQGMYDDPLERYKLIHPEDLARILTRPRSENIREQTELQYRIVRDDGEIRWIHLHNYPYIDENDVVTHLVGTAEDITERKYAEIALKESEERLQLALHTGNLGTWEWNLIENVLVWDAQHYHIWNLKSGESPLTVEQFLDSIHPDDFHIFTEAFEKAYILGKVERVEYRIVRADGEIRWLASQGQVHFNDEHFPVRVVGIVQDITSAKEDEQRRIDLALAEERSALLAEFLGNMSHDLRTPLTVINTSLDMLDRYKLEEENRQRKIEVIRLQTQLLENMIQNILTMSQLDHNPTVLIKPLDVNNILFEIITSMYSYAEIRNIKLTHDHAEQLPMIYANENNLYRAFSNLIKNALNYTGEHGIVHVETGLQNDRVQIKISDTGIGIDEKDLPFIFDRFFRADKSRPSDDGGTGLGLAIVKKIIEMHHGEISVKSTPGTGTTFTVWLPLKFTGNSL